MLEANLEIKELKREIQTDLEFWYVQDIFKF